jgi:hypothetical protein
MPPPSNSRNFFDAIRTSPDPVAFIRNLFNPASPMSESDWLDFKEPPRLDAVRVAGLDHGKWREIWVEALSGFANNQGGVLIWGIEARKDPATNIDAASGEKPVNNPNGLKSRLAELQRQATDPPLANVEIDAYELPTAPGTGFVVCFVPEGSYKPYRAEDSRKSQYYLRAGDNFVVMPRSVLQSLFYPRAKAIFRVRTTLSWELLDRRETAAKDVARLFCDVELSNDGTMSARNAQVLVTTNAQSLRGTLDFRAGSFWGRSVRGSEVEFRLGDPLHPDRKMQLFTLNWDVNAEPWSDHRVVPACPAPYFSLTAYCENQEQQVFKIEFDRDELFNTGKTVTEAWPVE